MQNPTAFIPHILKRNREALEALITKPEVEQRLLLRLQKKAATYAQDIVEGDGNKNMNGNLRTASKIDVDGVVDLYESYIIPLTKEVEVRIFFDLSFTSMVLDDFCVQVDYLLCRLDGLSKEEIDILSKSKANDL